jgi:hypothetical protein
MKMNRRSDTMRVAAMLLSVVFLVASAVFAALGDSDYAGVCVGNACVFLLWAIIIKLEWL